jgi:hypothetical protein
VTTSALPALSDIPEEVIPGVLRIENSDKDATTPIIMDMLRSVYPHDQVFGEYCPVQAYIAAPPQEVFEYLSDTRSLEEWTYSLRGFVETEEPGLWLAYDRLGDETEIFTRTVAHQDGMTVDYHCAWDQQQHLWMVYLLRAGSVQQAGFGGAVGQLQAPLLRRKPLSRDGTREAACVGGRLLGNVLSRTSIGNGKPQGDLRISGGKWVADQARLDEVRHT